MPKQLSVAQVGDLDRQAHEQHWMIESVWSRAAVGIIGGSPKSCKSWMGLDMALSVASGTPCLDTFPVNDTGPAIVYLAEDALPMVRNRVECLCQHRHLDIQRIQLHVITSPSLRLDLVSDQESLKLTLAAFKPRLLLLDPLVRMHRLDENSASDISRLLGFLRECQRTFDCAIILVHHASKKQRAQPGQALRGSSDLHAFGDSNAYLARTKDRLTLTLEHRSAKPPDPFQLFLDNNNEDCIHLAVDKVDNSWLDLPLSDRLLKVFRQHPRPLRRTYLRESLRINNKHLGDTLTRLCSNGLISRDKLGWSLITSE